MKARKGGDTPEGRQAYGIPSWAWEDPEDRAAEVLDRIRELARAASGAALREVQDIAVRLLRGKMGALN